MTGPRCYTIADLVAQLKMPHRTFFRLWKAGELPFLEELRPRLGRRPRFRADLIDRYFAGLGGGQRTFGSSRKAG